MKNKPIVTLITSITITLKCLQKRNNRDFLSYFLSINNQFLHCLHLSISQESKRSRRKLENLTSISASNALCVTDHLSVCMLQYHVLLSSGLQVSINFLTLLNFVGHELSAGSTTLKVGQPKGFKKHIDNASEKQKKGMRKIRKYGCPNDGKTVDSKMHNNKAT